MDSKLILIVEDELIIAKDISEILTNEGYSCVDNITTYAQAIDAVEVLSPDLVLIDIMLKGAQSGIEIGDYLNKRGLTPYVYLTSLSDKQTVLDIKGTYPYGFILKPFKKQELIVNVELAISNFKHVAIDVNKMQSPVLNNEVPYVLKQVVAHINANLHERVKVKDLASMTRWTEHHFIKLFFQYMKVTPHQYIIKSKLERSIHMINTTDLSAPDIAFELGFSSYSNFSKIFKKNMNITIEEYRKQVRISKAK